MASTASGSITVYGHATTHGRPHPWHSGQSRFPVAPAHWGHGDSDVWTGEATLGQSRHFPEPSHPEPQ
jgi:hypothetical protein